jgi:hypothetical protein
MQTNSTLRGHREYSQIAALIPEAGKGTRRFGSSHYRDAWLGHRLQHQLIKFRKLWTSRWKIIYSYSLHFGCFKTPSKISKTLCIAPWEELLMFENRYKNFSEHFRKAHAPCLTSVHSHTAALRECQSAGLSVHVVKAIWDKDLYHSQKAAWGLNTNWKLPQSFPRERSKLNPASVLLLEPDFWPPNLFDLLFQSCRPWHLTSFWKLRAGEGPSSFRTEFS